MGHKQSKYKSQSISAESDQETLNTESEMFQQTIHILHHLLRMIKLNLPIKYNFDFLIQLIFNYCNNYVFMTQYPKDKNIKLLNNGSLVQYTSDGIVGIDQGIDFLDITNNFGFKYNINSFSCKLLCKTGFNFAVGFITKPENVEDLRLFHPGERVNGGLVYFINTFGYIGHYDKKGELHSKREMKKRNENDNDYASRILENDIIVVTLNMNNYTITYEINGTLIFEQKDIVKDLTYYPTLFYASIDKDEYFECQLNVDCRFH